MKADPKERGDWLGVEVNVKLGAWGASYRWGILALKGAPGPHPGEAGQQGMGGDGGGSQASQIWGMVSSFIKLFVC